MDRGGYAGLEDVTDVSERLAQEMFDAPSRMQPRKHVLLCVHARHKKKGEDAGGGFVRAGSCALIFLVFYTPPPPRVERPDVPTLPLLVVNLLDGTIVLVLR